MSESAGTGEKITELKRGAFLRRLAEVAQGDTSRWIPVGLIGEELGLPYEETLAITDALRERGLVRRGGGGRLEPPIGPRVRLLPEALSQLDGETAK